MYKIRYWLPFLAVWIVLCVLLFLSIFDTAKNHTIEALNARQLIHAQQAAQGIERFFSRRIEQLTALSEKEGVATLDLRGLKAMMDLFDNSKQDIAALARIDANGSILFNIPEMDGLGIKDIAKREDVRGMLQARKPVLSDVIRTLQGNDAVALHVPVFDTHKFAGSLLVLIDLKTISRNHLDTIRIGTAGYAWILNAQGTEIICPVPGHVGHSIFETCKTFPTIIEMANAMLAGKTGTTVYRYDWIKGDQTKTLTKHAVYMPIRILDTFWSIVVTASESEVLSSLETFKDQLFIIFSMILLGSIMFTYLGLKASHVLSEDEKRTLAEISLRESEERYRCAMEAAYEPMVVYDTKGRATYINPAFTRVFGWTPDDVLGGRLDFVPEAEKEISARQIELLQQQGTVKGFETKRLTKSGQLLDIRISASVFKDKAGRNLGAVVNLTDVTEKKEREELYHRLFEQANDAILLMQGQVFIDCNTRTEEMFGAPRDEIIGKTPADFSENNQPCGENSVAYTTEKLNAAFKGEPQSFEWRHVRPGGERFDVEVNLSSIRMGGKDYAQAIVRDITQRKRAAEALARSEERYREIVEGTDNLVTEVDMEGRFTFVNETAHKIFGLPPEACLGRMAFDFVHEDDKERTLRHFARWIEEKKPGTAFENRQVSLAGDVRDMLWTISFVFDDQGDITSIKSIARDITERKQAERELEGYRKHLEKLVEQRTQDLRESEEKYRNILESMAEGYYEVDLTGALTIVNDSFCSMWGYSRQELIGMDNRQYTAPEEAKRIYRQFKRIFRTGCSERILDCEIIRKDGQRRTVETSVSLRHDQSGTPNGFWGVVRDITDRIRFERELETAKELAESANQAKSEFLANMSHEIRTPMNAVVGMSELLLTTSLTGKQKEYAQAVSDAAIALLAILDDILDLSKIQAGKLSIEKVPFDLREIVEQVGQILAVRAKDKAIEILVRYPLDMPSRYAGDPTRIRQVLMNLAGNAVKFTDKGHVLIDVHLEAKNGDHCTICFTVTDTGIGIPAEQIGTLFEQFSQADESTTRRYGGTGLGLAISKKLVDMMDGTIKVESTVGQGSVFSFNLSLPCSADAGCDIGLDVDLADVRVLVVDDNPRNREITMEYLQLRSIPGEAADSAEMALDLLRREKDRGRPFDVAVLDHRMPGMNGGQLALLIKNDPRLKDTVLILLSSFIPVDDLTAEIRACFAGSLNKPIKVSVFFETLMDAWNGHLNGKPRPVSLPSAPPLAFEPLFAETRVLLTEDSRMNQQVAKEVLKRFGCRVDVAVDGKEAVHRFASTPYDLIFMDVHMPVMDGFEATRAIRDLEGRGDRIPIVAMTALAMQGDREKCIAAGMDDYIAKPIRSTAVKEVLMRMLTPECAGPANGNPETEESLADGALVLNPERLRDISGADIDLLRTLIGAFERDAPAYLAALHEALKDTDTEEIYKKSHRLKGLAANAGGERVLAILSALEADIRRDGFTPEDYDPGPLESELAALQRALQETDWASVCQPG